MLIKIGTMANWLRRKSGFKKEFIGMGGLKTFDEMHTVSYRTPKAVK